MRLLSQTICVLRDCRCDVLMLFFSRAQMPHAMLSFMVDRELLFHVSPVFRCAIRKDKRAATEPLMLTLMREERC